MAKVLLVNPAFDTKSISYPWMPLGLLSLATIVASKGHDIKIFDRDIDRSDEEFLQVLKSFNPDIVGIQSYVGRTLKDLIFLSEIVKKNSNALVVIGGIMATVIPEPFLKNKNFDYIVRGEGELVLLEMCELIDKNKRDFSKIFNVDYNPMRAFINLNDYPVPDYSLIDVKKYPIASFITSRGCPGNCTFCYNDYYWGKLGKKCIRMYNTEKTIEMFINVIEKYKIKDFIIADDNFANMSKRTADVCEALSKYDVFFQCELRTDNAQDQVMGSLKKAGCWGVQFGIESGSQKILDFIQKGTSVEQNAKGILQCKKFGIHSDASCMIGLPTETVNEMNETINFLKKYKPDTISAKKFTPFPGTSIFEYCVEEGLLKKPTNLEEYSSFEISSPEPNVSLIPTDVLMNTIAMLNKKSLFTDVKKTMKLLKAGHYKYIAFKTKGRIKNKLWLDKK